MGSPKEWSVNDAALLEKLIRRYTREAGVRNLEREISNTRPQGA
jgi:ATP-dependent Lon protease